MPAEDAPPLGAFADALVDVDHIRSFMEEVVRPLKEEEEALAKPWRSGFRVQLPFFRLLDERQQAHLRGIFAHMLPDPEVELAAFDREELILLDVLSETYVTQARIFAELMGDHEYRVTSHVRRDAPGRAIALTLSASVFVFDAPDRHRKRRYRYQNIYGNRHVTPEGRCRLKGHLRLAETVRALEFRSSPLLMLAVHPEGSRYKMAFKQESQVVSDTFTSRMMEVTFHANSSFHAYTDVRPLAEIQAELDEDPEPEGEAQDPTPPPQPGSPSQRLAPPTPRPDVDSDPDPDPSSGAPS
jgi:hypothetical protein